MPPQPVGSDTQLQILIDRSLNGDAAAREGLLDHSCDRLLALTRKMFHDFPKLRRWEQTDDVFQKAMLRLHDALADVKVESVRSFFGLAALHVRWELLDMAKHYYGPRGIGKNHHTDGVPSVEPDGAIGKKFTQEPKDIDQWTFFHEQVQKLPAEELEVFDLLFYQNLTQEEAALVLGTSVRTLKRRWQNAKLKLNEACSEQR